MTRAVSSSGDYEWLVVDNSDSDHIQPEVERMNADSFGRIRYLFEPRRGRSFALNAGVQAARGAILVIVHNDIVPEPGWLDVVVGAFDRSDMEVVSGPVLPEWEGERPAWFTEPLLCKVGLINYGIEPRWLDTDHIPLGCNIAFRREVFNRIGLYDTALGREREVFLADEEDEFFTRALRAGVRIYYEPKAAVQRRVPPERMCKGYLRRLESLSGMSNARRSDPHVTYLLNIPRYYYSRLIATVAQWFWFMLSGQGKRAFQQELFFWYLKGYVEARWGCMTPGVDRS